MLSARELNLASLPNRTWISEHLTYTHGYGLTLGPVNQVTGEGLPVLFVRNLPPETTVPELRVDEPSIYFGELSNDYVIVRTKHAGVPLSARRRQRRDDLRRARRRRRRALVAEAAVRLPLRRLSDLPERRHRPGEPDPLQPADRRPRARRSRRS